MLFVAFLDVHGPSLRVVSSSQMIGQRSPLCHGE
jgi:hypothetical protein